MFSTIHFDFISVKYTFFIANSLKQEKHTCNWKQHQPWTAMEKVIIITDRGVCGHTELYDDTSTCTETGKKKKSVYGVKTSKEVGLPCKSWKYVSAKHIPDQSKLSSELTKCEFRLLSRQHYDVVIVLSFWFIYCHQTTEKSLWFGFIPMW